MISRCFFKDYFPRLGIWTGPTQTYQWVMSTNVQIVHLHTTVRSKLVDCRQPVYHLSAACFQEETVGSHLWSRTGERLTERRQADTDRQTDRQIQTVRQTDRQTDRQTETDRKTLLRREGSPDSWGNRQGTGALHARSTELGEVLLCPSRLEWCRWGPSFLRAPTPAMPRLPGPETGYPPAASFTTGRNF